MSSVRAAAVAACLCSIAGASGATSAEALRGKLRSARLAIPSATADRSEHLAVRYLVSFGRDARGRLYAVSLNGPVYRISR